MSSGLSINNYDALLIGWSQLELENNVLFGGFSQYCNGADARQYIIDNFNWNITDGGYNCDGVSIDEDCVGSWYPIMPDLSDLPPIECNSGTTLIWIEGIYVDSEDSLSYFEPFAINWLGIDSEAVPAGEHQLSITDANGCEQIITYFIPEPEALEVVDNPIIINASCNANDGAININISGGNPEYNTVLGAGSSGLIIGEQSGSEVLFENLAPGEYFFSTQDANGCLMAGDEIFFEIFEINCDESCDTVYIEVPVIEYIDCDTGLPCTSGMAEIIEKSKTNGKLYNLLGQEVFRREGIYIEGGEIKYRF